jgi:hypothetical protein
MHEPQASIISSYTLRRIDTGIVKGFIDPDHLSTHDPRASLNHGIVRKCRRNPDPSILQSGNFLYCLDRLSKILILAEYQRDIVLIRDRHSHDIDFQSEIDALLSVILYSTAIGADSPCTHRGKFIYPEPVPKWILMTVGDPCVKKNLDEIPVFITADFGRQ